MYQVLKICSIIFCGLNIPYNFPLSFLQQLAPPFSNDLDILPVCCKSLLPFGPPFLTQQDLIALCIFHAKVGANQQDPSLSPTTPPHANFSCLNSLLMFMVFSSTSPVCVFQSCPFLQCRRHHSFILLLTSNITKLSLSPRQLPTMSI